MTVKEMDKLCSSLSVHQMCERIGLDAKDHGDVAYTLSSQVEGGVLKHSSAADLTRIGAMIGYAKAEMGRRRKSAWKRQSRE